MIDHIKTAAQLERITGTITCLGMCHPDGSPRRHMGLDASLELLGLADYHRSKADTPDMHMKAEDLLQRMSQEMREHVDDMQEAEVPSHLYGGMEALISEANAYFVELLEPATEGGMVNGEF